jgi:multisubunit Na+/H+ antiporter MnhG subunit
MKIKLKGSTYFLIAIMLIMVAVIIDASKWEEIQSKMLPLIYGILIFILTAIVLFQELKGKKETKRTVTEGKAGEVEKHEKHKEGWRGYFIAGAWVVGFFLALYLLGIILATFLFIGSYLKTHGVRWLTIILCTILTPAIMYLLFEYFLELNLYRGLIFNLLMSL